jgi:small subunit ribosomal protein S3
MGQKVNPTGLRLGINKSWLSRWFVDPKQYADTLHEDLRLRRTILASEEARGADIAKVEVVRHPQRVTVIIHTGRPGVLIGAKGANIEKLGGTLQKLIGKKIKMSGRLNGSEIARREEFKEGRIPLHTFRADIDYDTATAVTTFGCIGVKVWIFNGEVYGHEMKDDAGLLVRRGHEGRDGRDERGRDERGRDDRGRDRRDRE